MATPGTRDATLTFVDPASGEAVALQLDAADLKALDWCLARMKQGPRTRVAELAGAVETSAAVSSRPKPSTFGTVDEGVRTLLTMKEAATAASYSVSTIERAIRSGALPAVRNGRTVRIEHADLMAFIDNAKA